MNSQSKRFFARGCFWLLGLWLAFAGFHVSAATSASNIATVTPPLGIIDPSGGCDQAVPSNCTGNNTSTSTVNVWAATVLKSAAPASGTSVVAGQTISYTLTVTVTGAATTVATELTDTLSAGLSFGAVSAPGVFTAGGSGQVRTFTLPAGTAPGSYSVTYTATVNAGVTSGTVSNAVTSPVAACATVGSCTTSHSVGVVTLNKALTGESITVDGIAQAGENLTYTITMSNQSSVAVTGYTLTDILGVGLTYVSASNGGVNTGQTVNWTGLTIPANSSLAVTVVANVNIPITTTSVSNIAKPTGDADPPCPSTNCVVTPTASTVSVVKALTGESGTQSGIAEPSELLTYTITLTNHGAAASVFALTDTLGAGLVYVSSDNGGVNSGDTTTWTNLQVPAGGTLDVTLVARVLAPITTATVRNIAKRSGDADPGCPSTGCVEIPTAASVTPLKQLTAESGRQPGVAEYGETLSYTITLTNSGGTSFRNYRFTENVPLGATLVGVTGALGFNDAVVGPAIVDLQVSDVPARGSHMVTINFQLANPIPAGVTHIVNQINGGDIDPGCGTNCTVTTPVELPTQLSIIKTVNVREAKAGDLVRYQLLVTNVGAADVINGILVDTPPQGFNYVEGSMVVVDGNNAFTLGPSQYPLEIGELDLAVGRQASVTYLMRVGAGVRKGVHANQVQAFHADGRQISNIATAQLTVVADPLVDESLILGTVFDDRDGDGWQDPASLSGVYVQGGFAPRAYIANSTAVDRGQGPKLVTDTEASSPLLQGLAVGRISGLQSDADRFKDHQIVIRQRLKALDFTSDFVLTNEQGATVYMDADGKTRTEKSGAAAKGLNGAIPVVSRRVMQSEGSYVVEYVIGNKGVDERGIPGVRIASAQGVLIETDQFGRYHLTGISVGDYERGRNFVLKIDESTLPRQAEFTTVNPLVRRITSGLPVRFDFGVKLPVDHLSGSQQFDIEMGEVLFEPGKSELRAEYLTTVRRMAEKMQEYGGGEVLITANGERESLALARAGVVQQALQPMLSPEVSMAVTIVTRADVRDPTSMVVGLAHDRTLLGTVLFDTDKSDVKPAFLPLLTQIAQTLKQRGGGLVQIVGHTDKRASDAYNLALGLRRAKAVYEAIAAQLKPEMRAKVQIEFGSTQTQSRPVRKQGD